VTAAGYANLSLHRSIAELIMNHSRNREDIREVAKRQVTWREVRTMLDLGCGYGWVEQSVPPGLDYILGLDCLAENRAAFLETSGKIAKGVEFKQVRLSTDIPAPSTAFDLVIAAYSLYFFPGIIPEVKRLLRPQGVFLVITHSESMLEEGQQFFDFRNLREVIRSFSAENGEEKLRNHFSRVDFIDYPNTLLFTTGSDRDLASYIDFKKEFISRDVDPKVVTEKMLEELRKNGSVKFNKDDRIFVARQ
jgi:SAM-dependent methyltransferase